MSVPRNKTPNATCARCGKPIYRPMWRQRDNRARYCSRECGRPSLNDRFWNKVAIGSPDACWEWQACRHKAGYGQAYDGKTVTKAHRVAWQLTYGTIPNGYCVLHRCDNPPCCNPSHLFIGTHSDNMTDMAQKGRSTKGRPNPCLYPERIARGEANPSAKITEKDVTNIRLARNNGARICDLAAQYGLSPYSISRIIHGKSWKHVPLPDSSTRN